MFSQEGIKIIQQLQDLAQVETKNAQNIGLSVDQLHEYLILKVALSNEEFQNYFGKKHKLSTDQLAKIQQNVAKLGQDVIAGIALKPTKQTSEPKPTKPKANDPITIMNAIMELQVQISVLEKQTKHESIIAKRKSKAPAQPVIINAVIPQVDNEAPNVEQEKKQKDKTEPVQVLTESKSDKHKHHHSQVIEQPVVQEQKETEPKQKEKKDRRKKDKE